MKKTNLFKRFLAMTLVLCMSFSMMAFNVFAVDSEAGAEEEPSSIGWVNPTSDGDVIMSGMADITDSATITLTLRSGDWSTDFYAGVLGNAGARYEVELTTPYGTTTHYVTGGNYNLSYFGTLTYAPPGDYKFKFTRLTGSSTEATAIAEICD